MNSQMVSQVMLPAALFLIMFGLGCSLQVKDFFLLLRKRKALYVGLFSQLLVLPVAAISVVSLFNLEPLYAIGIILVALAPGGASSNMISFLCRADVALSISLTAIVGLLAPFILPLIAPLAIKWQVGGYTDASFEYLPLMAKLFTVSVLPVLLGLFLRSRAPVFCQRLIPVVKLISILFLGIVVLGLFVKHQQNLLALTETVFPAALCMTVVAFLAGYILAKLSGLSIPQQLTLSIETGIQNAGVGLMVSSVWIPDSDVTMTILLYGLVMNIPALLLILIRNLFSSYQLLRAK